MSSIQDKRAKLAAKRNQFEQQKKPFDPSNPTLYVPNINTHIRNISGPPDISELVQDQSLQQQQNDTPQKKKANLKTESYIGEILIKQEEKITVEMGTQITPEVEEASSPEKVKENEEPHSIQKIRTEHLQKSQEEQQQQPKPQQIELSEEDVVQIIKSGDFLSFFNRSSKLMEKALNKYEPSLIEDGFDDEVENLVQNKNDPFHLEAKFYDNQYSGERVVSALQWSPNVNDLFLTAYSQTEERNINDHDGVVLLWSQQLKNRPEFQCFYTSQVTSACFYPFNRNQILGGCYNGQVVIWDLRAKQLPTQRSTQEGHAYPIYSLDVVGTQNAHNIVSISNDGTICTWAMNNLAKPLKKAQLQPQKQETDKTDISEVNVTCMEFKEGESNQFVFGGQDGCLGSFQLHSSQNTMVPTLYSGHSAPITALSQNTMSDSQMFQNLVLTSSFDWSVKMWNVGPGQTSQECVYTFENSEDYVYDVKWNPQNPYLFATADGEGNIDLWDLQEDFETPVGRQQFSTGNSVNCIRWNQSGDKLLAGDSQGNVELYQIQKKFLKYDSSKINEIESFLKNNQ